MTIFGFSKLRFYVLGVFLLNFSSGIQAQEWYDVRLVDGYSGSEGRVEIYYSWSWGTVCDDGWGTDEADVVCRQLGFQYASNYYTSAHFGEGTGSIWLDDVDCSGYESSLIYCSHNGLGTHNCAHYEDVSVECYPPSSDVNPSAPPANTLRLVDGSTTYEGRLEIYHHGSWGTICHDFWDPDDAEVACRQLGFPGVDRVYHNAEFGEGSGRVWLANLLCNGDEAELVECDLYWEPSLDVCPHSEDVGVRCTDPDATLRLVGGSTSSEGRVEVLYNGQWGTICDDGWDMDDADVVCRQLGYSRAIEEKDNAYFGEGTGNIWLDGVSCIGGETSIEDCQHGGWGVHNCGHHEDAGVRCYDGDDTDEEGGGDDGLTTEEIAGIAVGSILGCCLLLCIITKSCKNSNSQASQNTPNTTRTNNNDIVPITYHNYIQTMNYAEPDDPSAPPPSYDQLNKFSSYVNPEGAPPPPHQTFDPVGGRTPGPSNGAYPTPSHQGTGYHMPPSGQAAGAPYPSGGGSHAGDPRFRYHAAPAWQAPPIGSHPSSYPPPGGAGGNPSGGTICPAYPALPPLAQPAPVPQGYAPPQQGYNK